MMAQETAEQSLRRKIAEKECKRYEEEWINEEPKHTSLSPTQRAQMVKDYIWARWGAREAATGGGNKPIWKQLATDPFGRRGTKAAHALMPSFVDRWYLACRRPNEKMRKETINHDRDEKGNMMPENWY